MKAKTRFTALSLALMMAGLSLVGCGSAASTTTAAAAPETTSNTTGGKQYTIGVLQLIQHPALDETNKGFVDAVNASGLSVRFDQQNASGEQSACQTIAEKFVNDRDDLIFAIATPAAQAAAAATEEIPIVISAVTDPAASGLVATNNAPGGNVTGTSDLTPVREQIDLLKQMFPDAKTVGILYCTSEANSALQLEMAKQACTDQGLTAKEYSVSSSNEIQSVTESMVGNVDVIYVPTDNTIAAGISTVASVATDHKIPIISGEEGQLEGGGLATYGIDYYELGKMAGEQAVSILKGEKKPGEIPIGYLSASQCTLMISKDQADALGIDVSSLKISYK